VVPSLLAEREIPLLSKDTSMHGLHNAKRCDPVRAARIDHETCLGIYI